MVIKIDSSLSKALSDIHHAMYERTSSNRVDRDISASLAPRLNAGKKMPASHASIV